MYSTIQMTKVDVSKSILANNYESDKLLELFNSFDFLSDDQKTLILSELAFFIGLSEEGKKSEKTFRSNINYISKEIGRSVPC